MKFHQCFLAAALTAASFLRADTGAALPPSEWTVSSGFDYTTGKYGQSSSTDILSIPVIGRFDTGRWTFKATFPWTRISGPADVVPDLGLIRHGRARATTQTESGVGDLVTAATFNAVNQSDSVSLDLTGKIKFGTASRSKGLGTGENDYSLQADVYQQVDALTPFVTLGYRFLGDPPGINLNNIWFASIGASYRLTPPTSVGAVLDWQQKSSDGVDDVAELTAFLTQKLNQPWKLQVYVLTGFTNASADFGLGGLVSYSF